ncbi:hypothetical protein VP01_432g3 [Puccinia sorghi]|uniref:Uncharacterized protein n=1 Tax=Puccinia sorghi TaxID=27349 RepID=A0A0L6UPY0_9BASI|nr:hypothetical protein VP01_432g3 [Puccinia sorghi]
MTANNESYNVKMAVALSLEIPHFKSETHLLGCAAHVINFVAQVGIKSLRSIKESDTKQPLSKSMVESPSLGATQNPMHILFVTSPPNKTNINTKTILKRVHGLCMFHQTQSEGNVHTLSC